MRAEKARAEESRVLDAEAIRLQRAGEEKRAANRVAQAAAN